MASPPPPVIEVSSAPSALPHVSITFCVQCKWNLRAAYFAQELLSTFGTQIGQVSLLPSTGGIFTVHLTYIPISSSTQKTSPAASSSDLASPESLSTIVPAPADQPTSNLASASQSSERDSTGTSSTSLSSSLTKKEEESVRNTSISRAAGEGHAPVAASAAARTVLIWDRKAASGFPETKVLKQRIRDCIAPGKRLGHSDVGGKNGVAVKEESGEDGSGSFSSSNVLPGIATALAVAVDERNGSGLDSVAGVSSSVGEVAGEVQVHEGKQKQESGGQGPASVASTLSVVPDRTGEEKECEDCQ